LEGLVRAKGEQWGQIFCIIILLIFVISRMQEALNDFPKQDNDTLSDIQELENVFFTLTEIFHNKYKTKNRARQHNLFRDSSQTKQ
jgi:hypothetical protein